MNEDDSFALAPPPFDAGQGLEQLKRSLRDLKLTQRGTGFDLRGKRVAEFEVDGVVIRGRLARRLALTPEWDRIDIKSTTEQRKCVDDLKKRIERWERDE
jgi:hypothetical protein